MEIKMGGDKTPLSLKEGLSDEHRGFFLSSEIAALKWRIEDDWL